MSNKNWKTLYQCPCGEIYTSGVGKWDTKFFLSPELCTKCGESKDEFEKLGVAYWKSEPTLFHWFRGRWIMKKTN